MCYRTLTVSLVILMLCQFNSAKAIILQNTARVNIVQRTDITMVSELQESAASVIDETPLEPEHFRLTFSGPSDQKVNVRVTSLNTNSPSREPGGHLYDNTDYCHDAGGFLLLDYPNDQLLISVIYE